MEQSAPAPIYKKLADNGMSPLELAILMTANGEGMRTCTRNLILLYDLSLGEAKAVQIRSEGGNPEMHMFRLFGVQTIDELEQRLAELLIIDENDT